MRVEVVRRTMGDRLELAPAPRKQVLDVDTGLRVVRTFFLGQLVETQAVRTETVVGIPGLAAVDPLLKNVHIVSVVGNEIFELGLFELPNAEREVSRRDLDPKRFADLRDAERRFLACRLIH